MNWTPAQWTAAGTTIIGIIGAIAAAAKLIINAYADLRHRSTENSQRLDVHDAATGIDSRATVAAANPNTKSPE